MKIVNPARRRPDRVLLEGLEGVGKSTWAANAPDPFFLDIDDGLSELAQKRPVRAAVFGDDEHLCCSYTEAQEFVRDFPVGSRKTAVVDTADALDLLIQKHICEQMGWKSIEDPGYGKGWTRAAEEWNRFLAELKTLHAKGVEIILLAHTAIKTAPNPLGADSVTYAPALSKQGAILIKQWATAIFFAAYEEEVKTASSPEKTNITKDRGKMVSTGQRIIHTEHSGGRDGKNRLDLPSVLPLDYKVFDEHRAAFWNKNGSPSNEAPPPASAPDTPTPRSAGTPAPLSSGNVGLALGEVQKAFAIKSVVETKQRFMEPVGVEMLKDASPEQLVKIVEKIAEAYKQAGVEPGANLQAVQAKLKGAAA